MSRHDGYQMLVVVDMLRVRCVLTAATPSGMEVSDKQVNAARAKLTLKRVLDGQATHSRRDIFHQHHRLPRKISQAHIPYLPLE